MKIAIVYDMIYPYNIGGAEVRNYTLAKKLVEMGHDVHLYGIKMWKGPNIIKKQGIIIHGVNCYKKKYNFKGQRNLFEPIIFSYYLFWYLIKEKFDLIDCSAFPYFPAIVCKTCSVIRKNRLVITWHEVWRDYWYEYMGIKGVFGFFIEKVVSRLTKNIISVSKRTKKGLIKLGISKNNIKVVENWVDNEEIESIRKLRQNFDVIYAGRFMKHKNVDLIVNSIYILKKKFPDIRVILIGDGPEKEKIIQLIKELGLQKNIETRNFMLREKIYEYMKSSKSFILPSVIEGFGIIVIEANACGLPVVTVRHKRNASADLIKDYHNGFVCNLSPDEIAEKTSILL
ncbi:MAG: glycosyltransferase, partial [Candidatus Nanoarchaeia archaeon]|nr:glycosyltransferase [Candidatus Nanoarchaeia archaeon]